MRAKCTEYLPIRFEKVVDQDRFDDDGEERNQSSWEKAVRTQVQGMSRRDIVNEIRRLEDTTQDVTQKKGTLTPALLRQLDITIDQLSRCDHDTANFVWTLTQIDHQLKQIDPRTAMQRDRIPLGHKISRTRAHASSSRRRSSSSLPGAPKKKYWERVSLTAYFKRSPRPHVNIPFLYQMKRRALAMTQGGMPSNGMNMGPQGTQPGHNGPNGGPQGGVVRGPPPPPPNGGRAGGPPPPPPPVRNPNGNAPPVILKNVPRKKKAYNEDYSDSDSGSSFCSDDTSSSGGTHTTFTTDTPSSSSKSYEKRGRHRDRSRRRGHSRNRHRESSRAFGIDPKHHKRHETHYMQDTGSRFPPAPPPPIIQPAYTETLEKIKDDAYHAGRADERYNRRSPPLPPIVTTSASDIDRIKEDAYRAGAQDARLREDRFVEEYDVGTRPRRVAMVIQPPRHSVRTVNPRLPREPLREAPRAGYTDDGLAYIERLSIDDRDRGYHERRPRRYAAYPLREYDYDSHFDSVEDEDFGLPAEAREIQERPYPGPRRRTTDDFLLRRDMPRTMEFDYNSGSHPFTPRVPLARGPSYERRR